ncbi:MAG: HAD-IA family hydrolase [Thiopseudomonas sp.]|nr:HAD-IA family hydrolase [Thiopseudomonas sp.]
MTTDIRLLIFDWDGTLVDSLERIVGSMHHAAEVCGIDRLSDDAIRAIIGLSLDKAIVQLYPHLTDDPQQVERMRQAYSDHYLAQEYEPSPFYPGVRDALDNFRSAGYQLAVATGKSRKGLARVLDGHGMQDFFDITRCADETRSKPDPLMLQQILHHCGQTPAQAIMVGDSPFDLRMANRAQVASVAVSYGAQPLSVLLQEQPVLAIDHFAELQCWLAANR